VVRERERFCELRRNRRVIFVGEADIEIAGAGP
jgi:hypothetical protein